MRLPAETLQENVRQLMHKEVGKLLREKVSSQNTPMYKNLQFVAREATLSRQNRS